MRIQNVATAALLLAGGLWGDQIVLKDGDRITGTIVRKDGEKLTIRSKNFGVVTLNRADVETITTENPVNVVLSGDRAVKGALATQDGRIVVRSAGDAQTVAPAEVLVLRNDAEQRAYERF